jgi:hypothetical protein
MLSDEVSLGKTIESCLILHRLLLSGRANRILILVPESLVHQWFLEMLRRFNVWLHIFDAERCASIEAGEPGAKAKWSRILALLDWRPPVLVPPAPLPPPKCPDCGNLNS